MPRTHITFYPDQRVEQLLQQEKARRPGVSQSQIISDLIEEALLKRKPSRHRIPPETFTRIASF
ncbi:MAG: hypothetical protein F6K41_03325 [Symploca sp. SIO3E6]|nr:hypothetical protein [Symploca sp. SIO2C1]NEP55883.1 hypothetical protein [Symploca sp. SIO2G7]NES17962.1 hypothetical protein [Caldora sp. SIO3E6]